MTGSPSKIILYFSACLLQSRCASRGLCAPKALYAVNKHVSFGPYRTTFELAEAEVDDEHWSRTKKDGQAFQAAQSSSGPTSFVSGSSGNAC